MEKKIGSCFLRHQWSKWEDYKAPIISTDNPDLTYFIIRQKRECFWCGKRQNRDLK
jgi:hypothetical protein